MPLSRESTSGGVIFPSAVGWGFLTAQRREGRPWGSWSC
jgi:hypothetical protein